MAFQSRGNYGTLQAESTNAEVYQVGGVTAGQASRTEVSVRETGNRVTIPNNPYLYANFFIVQSRAYFPGRALKKYVYFRGLNTLFCLHLFSLLGLPFFLICTLHSAGWFFTFAALTVDIIAFLIYSQHLYINFTTIPWLLKLPVIPEQRLTNNHYVIDIATLDTAFIAAREAGVGVNITVGGAAKLKIMAFNQKGINYIRSAHNRAYLYISLAVTAGFWSLTWIVIQGINLTHCGHLHNDY